MFDSNRRKYPRAKYPCELMIQLDNGLNETMLATTSNIGVGGICVNLSEAVDAGTKFAIQINFTSPSTPFKCTGVVVRCVKQDNGSYNVGMQFDPLGELKFAFLDGKVSELIDLEQKGKKLMVRVRFAPSPTGFLHIGGARTALFNWMYARAQGGQFILRIEDTDKVRSKPEYLEEILESMKWLGLTWDEFYKQSDRFELYRQYADKLIAEGKAYRQGEAVLLKMPREEIVIDDLIRGRIVFDTTFFYKRNENNEIICEPDGTTPVLKDEVLIKTDGSPAYSFACVVDDSLMEISHVIRGEDHISNTPKQVVIYKALGLKCPKFVHLPLILDPEGGRMSKRAGATAVTEYRTQGYLPQAIVNYLMLLGWSPGNNQEKVLMASALKTFSIKKINKSGAAFSIEKLQWLNSQYIKEMDTAQLAEALAPLVAAKYPEAGFKGKDLEHLVQLYKGRMNTLLDFLDWTDFIFKDEVSFEDEVKAKHLSQDMRREFELLAEKLSVIGDFNVKAAEEAFRAVVAQLGIEAGVLVHPVRVALTGKAVGPGLFDTMVALGRERTIRRLKETFK